ncbi:bifunctional PIG-L family deacetylase/class I SAM-dependent methyltransferase [Cryobacterium sp. SO1]|uniref:bifunctional PIG-L family deacetylase/class I SAM-dependent methyltransferase n=1 Tax=Cryobacterium sp. SO1 TaxID=1897061 RepID=UPI0010230171|nr:bifunctional PIG-L family deacetylase/class I SAM-dependent methyltransferase [Cryobacterium sp. SO1]RZI36443.1 1D-myo-inositol 2-acetamido-2-deoxy-alpha-D-glucopyranoside deacetylase [Cryobacterium sp. SO1]
MVTFTHRSGGTSERVWNDADWSARIRPLALASCGRLIVVAAHPDDESLGAGGLIAIAGQLGLGITVILATNGEASHPRSPTLTPADLVAVRRVEMVNAVSALAPAAMVRLLDLPDGDLTQHRNSLEEALAAELAAELPGAGTADATWVVAPWRLDGHPDHAAAGEVAALVAARTGARLLEYPIWAWHWSSPGDPVWATGHGTGLWSLELDAAARQRKNTAMAAHTSQVQPLSDRPGDEAIVQPGFAAHFERSRELFIGAADEPAHGPHDDDAGATPSSRPSRPGSTTDAAAPQSLSAGFFDDFYAGSRDPWGFETRWYEARKRALTLAALPLPRYSAALELGCSIGVLSRDLADRSDTLLATDINEQALAVARERLTDLPGVRVERWALPGEWPAGTFDLVVLSEIGYYCSPADLAVLLQRCRQSLGPNGTLVACHWRHPVGEYPLGGDDVHAALAALPGLDRTVQHLERDFVLEVYEPSPAPSVAQREGLVS